MLDFIYYPVSAIMWFWHEVFGYLLGPGSGVSWALSVVFLVFTLRTLLIKPFISQVRSMRKMQEFAPEIQKLKKKHGDDRQKMAAEMQKLQSEHGVNPLGGCLPIFVQLPVFFGLFHVLRMFNRPGLNYEQNIQIANYMFPPADVKSFLDARLFGAPLSGWITMPSEQLDAFAAVTRVDIAIVAVPLMLLAGVLTHFTSRHSVARQSETQAANPQSAIMNKVMLYLFPIGVVIGGPFFPLAILLYWLSNNAWTLGQQYVIYHKIDSEEAEKKDIAVAQRQSLGPRPGQKPKRPKKGTTPPSGAGSGSTDGSSRKSDADATGAAAGDGEGGAAGVSGADEEAKAATDEHSSSTNGADRSASTAAAQPRNRGKKSNRKRR